MFDGGRGQVLNVQHKNSSNGNWENHGATRSISLGVGWVGGHLKRQLRARTRYWVGIGNGMCQGEDRSLSGPSNLTLIWQAGMQVGSTGSPTTH